MMIRRWGGCVGLGFACFFGRKVCDLDFVSFKNGTDERLRSKFEEMI